MISVYNRYSAYGGTVRRSQADEKKAQSAPPKTEAQSPEREKPPQKEARPVPARQPGLTPGNIDLGDIMLLAVLLLLYSDSRDEDFLIILGVLALSMFRPEKKE